MFGELEKICKTIGNTKAHINFLTQCLKGKFLPKGFISKCRLNTLESTQLENRFARIRMTEQRKYLHWKLSILENKEKDIPINIITDMVDWKNQAYFSCIKAQEAQGPQSHQTPPPSVQD